MQSKEFTFILRDFAHFSADEFFFILAYCVQKNVAEVEPDEVFKFVPKWKQLLEERKLELARRGIQYEWELGL